MSAAELVEDHHQAVPSISIANLLNQRRAVIDRIVKAMTLLEEARALARAAGIGFPYVEVKDTYGRSTRMWRHSGGLSPENEVENLAVKSVDAGAWKMLMDETGLRSFMDQEARRKWDEGLEKGEFPELTASSIEATFAAIHANRGVMFEQGVISVFRHLSWHYKTNLPQKFGKRIVMTYVTTMRSFVNHQAADKLDDLCRVFSVLDGKPEADHRSGCYRLLGDALTAKDREPENDYLRLRLFKNGNGHITFKRLDLVDKLNDIIARHYPGALPEPR